MRFLACVTCLRRRLLFSRSEAFFLLRTPKLCETIWKFLWRAFGRLVELLGTSLFFLPFLLPNLPRPSRPSLMERMRSS